MPFLGSGWYVDGNDEAAWARNASAMAEAVARQAQLGDNQVMPYGPSSPKHRALFCAARTLNATGQSPGHAIAAVRALKSSLLATTGGNGA